MITDFYTELDVEVSDAPEPRDFADSDAYDRAFNVRAGWHITPTDTEYDGPTARVVAAEAEFAGVENLDGVEELTATGLVPLEPPYPDWLAKAILEEADRRAESAAELWLEEEAGR